MVKEVRAKVDSVKCHFLREESRYLDFVIDKDRVKPDKDKVGNV